MSKSEYKKRLDTLKVTTDGALSRQWEQNHRNEYASALKRVVSQHKDWAASKDEKHSHITAEERKKVTDEGEAALKWLDAEFAKQSAVPIADPPVITCDQINKKKAALEAAAAPAINKPKPEPPKPKAEEPKKAEDPNAKKPEPAAAGSEKPPAGGAAPNGADAKPTASAAGADAKPAADNAKKA